MKLSTRARYGLRAVVELALRGAWKGLLKRAPSLKAIAKRQGIPEPYLRQVFVRLRRAGVVRSMRGAKGGYLLAREPDRLSVLDVIEALGERIEPVFCVSHPSRCRRVSECATRSVWCRLADDMKRALSMTTIGQLAEQCPGRGRRSLPRGYMFQI